MNNNHRKTNFYTQGQRWTIGVLLMVGMLGSCPERALAIGLGKLVFVGGVLFGPGSALELLNECDSEGGGICESTDEYKKVSTMESLLENYPIENHRIRECKTLDKYCSNSYNGYDIITCFYGPYDKNFDYSGTIQEIFMCLEQYNDANQDIEWQVRLGNDAVPDDSDTYRDYGQLGDIFSNLPIASFVSNGEIKLPNNLSKDSKLAQHLREITLHRPTFQEVSEILTGLFDNFAKQIQRFFLYGGKISKLPESMGDASNMYSLYLENIEFEQDLEAQESFNKVFQKLHDDGSALIIFSLEHTDLAALPEYLVHLANQRTKSWVAFQLRCNPLKTVFERNKTFKKNIEDGVVKIDNEGCSDLRSNPVEYPSRDDIMAMYW